MVVLVYLAILLSTYVACAGIEDSYKVGYFSVLGIVVVVWSFLAFIFR